MLSHFCVFLKNGQRSEWIYIILLQQPTVTDEMWRTFKFINLNLRLSLKSEYIKKLNYLKTNILCYTEHTPNNYCVYDPVM